MLTVYASNHTEHLVTELFAVLNQQKTNLLKPKKVIVDSSGMCHWLQLKMAETRGVAMNLQFERPTDFIWGLCKNLLDSAAVPANSPYREEVLTWRIDALLASGAFQACPEASEVTRYWLGDGKGADTLKRYQLASKLASIFVKYMTYRPDWIEKWEEAGKGGRSFNDMQGAHSESPDELWQAHLWGLLCAQELPGKQNIHPAYLQKAALACLKEKQHQLPDQVLLFGINTLPGPALAFFQCLAEYTHVHLFHLDPCAGLRSGKEEWINPLLATLGQQGMTFLDALQETTPLEVKALDNNCAGEKINEQNDAHDCILHRVQRDIHTLHQVGIRMPGAGTTDDSIHISSSHSSLREIQALHDYLLHLFNADPTLTPRDILVMCPNLEDYAPYIDAVFRRSANKQEAGAPPRLPCSIADRVKHEEEPLIAAFIDLLQLPDSRFELSRILDFLRVPAIQSKFGFATGDLQTIEWWLRESCVHWGVDSNHKADLADLERASSKFTWSWGLERLLVGYTYGDHEALHGERLLLPHVEGQNAILLGRLIHLLDRLRFHVNEMTVSRTAADWQDYLKQLKTGLFAPARDESNASYLIDEAINQLATCTYQAGYPGEIGFPVIQSYINQKFSEAGSGNSFMTGQITFCSTLPMRSIPVKVIAMLGLNDGKFPRQERMASFDLLKDAPPRAGDRSRRGDDRYLFLETLICAREKLYLSFQGRDIQSNEEKQPSLVLKELLHYLQSEYGRDAGYVHQQPMQPFSAACFDSAKPGFDGRWCRLAYPIPERNNLITLEAMELPDDPVDIETLVSFFDDPMKSFAQNRLNLHLDTDEEILDDSEPFEINSLTSYIIRSGFVKGWLAGEAPAGSIANMLHRGRLPDSPLTKGKLTDCQQEAELLGNAVKGAGTVTSERIEVNVAGIRLTASIDWLARNQKLLGFRAAKRKPKDDLRLWLQHLIATLHVQEACGGGSVQTMGLFFGQDSYDTIEQCLFCSGEAEQDARMELENLVKIWLEQGVNRPMVLHAQLGKKSSEIEPDAFTDRARSELGDNGYFTWFYGNSAAINLEDLDGLKSVYAPLYAQLTISKWEGGQ